jgi:hypothetical protein
MKFGWLPFLHPPSLPLLFQPLCYLISKIRLTAGTVKPTNWHCHVPNLHPVHHSNLDDFRSVVVPHLDDPLCDHLGDLDMDARRYFHRLVAVVVVGAARLPVIVSER